jgi:hypothetical protein
MKNLVFFTSCLGVLMTAASGAPLLLNAQGRAMPNPREMAGIPLPADDIAPGTVIVRVIKGSLSNPLGGQQVDLEVAGKSRTSKANAEGRATFTGLTPGSRARAMAEVGDERLVSQEFTVPERGGIRMMLVATDPEAERKAEEDRKLAQAPSQPGLVVLDEQSRFVFEMGDGGLSVYNILQILNTARTPVQPPQPVEFELPDDARGAAILDGSSRQASVVGKKVVVNGPFAPGPTVIQFAYSVPNSGGELTVEQRLPIALARVTVLAQKIGDMRLTSPQMTEHREMAAQGQTYIVGQGPPRNAGDVVSFQFSNLPHEPTWPRSLALTLATIILGVGAWASVRATRVVGPEEKRRNQLESRRQHLLSELTTVETEHRAGRLDPHKYAARRRELMAALERVYADLDQEAA